MAKLRPLLEMKRASGKHGDGGLGIRVDRLANSCATCDARIE